MFARSTVLAAGCIALVFGCATPADETQEIVGNLVKAGFPADDIMVVDGKVYVGRDAEVSLAASREMLEAGDTTEEQYRTTNLVSTSLSKICINGSTFTGVFSTALDSAIQNYDELPLTFAMARTPSSGCGFTINAVIDPNMNGGSAGFPSNGRPYGQITIGGQLSQYGVDVIEHVITHELGHTLGLRHSDYYNRSISCGIGGNEGDAGIGAIHIPGTPTTATVGGSIMNACFRSVETGEFTSGDITALRAFYTPPPSYTLGVTLDGSGFGSVVSTPAGINCPAGNCSASFPGGTLVTLTATPDSASAFVGWSGAGCGGTSTCTVSMAAASSVTATFLPAADVCPYNCTCVESYSGVGDPGPFGGAVIIRLDRTVECSSARVHFLAQGTTFQGNYASFDGYIDIAKGEYTNQHTYNEYANWLSVDAVSILDVQELPW